MGPLSVDESHLIYRLFGNSNGGTMLDVGAAFGLSLAPFARSGWDVHAFEPDPKNRSVLEKEWGECPNVTIVPKAVSDEHGVRTLYTSDESAGISSLEPFTAGHRASGHVPVITLGEYAAQHGIDSTDFLKIDVEGFEMNVLRGLDWSIRPRTLVLEFDDAKTKPLGYSWTDLATELIDRDYQVLVSEWYPVTRYGTIHSWRGFKQFPAELDDPRGWGNLIATDDRFDALTKLASRESRRYHIRDFVERLRPKG